MSGPLYHIVLFEPEIPQNTGNIGRIAVNALSRLHLIEPVGFQFDDRHLKRAGMDYWKHVDVVMHRDWDAFLDAKGDAPMYFFSTKGRKIYWSCPFEPGSYLVFGRESSGLPLKIHETYSEDFYTIPMPGRFSRSLNLANSVGIAVYEGLRKHPEGWMTA